MGKRVEESYPIDLRGVAIEVIDRMGLLPAVRAAHIATRQATCVDSRGRKTAHMNPADLGGTGYDVEIPRGRPASILYDATRDVVEYRFDDSISALEQIDDGVEVAFRQGERRTFGLVVGADGMHSNVRGLSFGPEEQFHHYVEQNQRPALNASGGMIPGTALGLWLRNRMLGIVPLILPLLRRLHLSPDAGLQAAANSLTLAATPSPLSEHGG